MEQVLIGSDLSRPVRPFPEEIEQLALSALNLAKASILLENHFLASAIARLDVRVAKLGVQFATDGHILAYDCERAIAAFRRDRGPAHHDLLHSVVHCLFLHPYKGAVEPALWNLACDIAAERVVAELLGPRQGNLGIAVSRIVEQVERDMQGRADAERLYRELCKGRWEQEAPTWAAQVERDAHDFWYAEPETPCDALGNAVNGSGSDSGSQNASSDSAGADGGPPQSQGDELEGVFEGSGSNGTGLTPQSGTASVDRLREQREWRDEATSLAVHLQTLSAGRGSRLVEFVADLEGAAREPGDYIDFLRSFGALGEVMRLSEDEFDYNFYTYGMKLYGDMPLIEPLEYREERRIREFVVAIDTSESVQGLAVRAFVRATFNVLKTTEAFFDRVRLRVLQCDNRVLSDEVVTNPADLKLWSGGAKVRGGGGTDFRPVFEYVEGLLEEGSMRDVDGLIYFTDGLGTYPTRAPSYKTAFVFYDEDLIGDDVPAWALRVVLDEEALNRADRRSIREEMRSWT